MPVNVKLLREELEYLTVHPERHRQMLWAGFESSVDLPENVTGYTEEFEQIKGEAPSPCGSFGCLAGNATVHQGCELDWRLDFTDLEDGKKVFHWLADNILGEDQEINGIRIPKTIDQKAQELLGLTPYQAGVLFDGDNDRDGLWELAEKLTLGEITGDKDDYHSDYAAALRKADQVKEDSL